LSKSGGGVNRVCLPCRIKYPSEFTDNSKAFNSVEKESESEKQQMSKTVKCPECFYHDALLESENAEPGTAEYKASVYCPSCESGMTDFERQFEIQSN